MRRRLLWFAPLLIAIPISCQKRQGSSRAVSVGKSVGDAKTGLLRSEEHTSELQSPY